MKLFLLGFVIVITIFAWKYRREKHLLWTALAAIGTCGAVIAVLWLPIYQKWANRPELEIRIPEYSDNFIRWAAQYGGDRRFYWVDIELKNIGLSIARDCQPFLTAIGEKKNDNWEKKDNWVPIGLEWILTTGNQRSNPYPEMRDLAPRRSHIFNLGHVYEISPNTFILARHSIPTGQPDKFAPGEYCFEVTVYSSNTEPIVKHFKVNWKGDFAQDEMAQFRNEENFKQKLTIKQLNNAPWHK